MTDGRPAPALSVVVVPLAGDVASLERCLRALAGQERVGPLEIVVPHDDRLQVPDPLRRAHPQVRFLPVAGERTYAELRARGGHAVAGDIVAFTEDHCAPVPAWGTSVLRLHRDGHAAVGGPVDKSGPDTLLNWAIYLCDFSRYMNPVPEGPSGYLTDVNVTYKREKLEELAELWRTEFHETTINWTLLARGETLWLSPDVAVEQRRAMTPRAALAERGAFGRLFAATRVAAVSAPKRALYATFALALPLLLTARVTRNVLGRRRNVGWFLRALPWIVVLNVVWSAGEFAGYLTGRARLARVSTGGRAGPP